MPVCGDEESVRIVEWSVAKIDFDDKGLVEGGTVCGMVGSLDETLLVA
jgi:hypothetical protein